MALEASDIDDATLSVVNDQDLLQLNTPTQTEAFITSQDLIASTSTQTNTCQLNSIAFTYAIDVPSQTLPVVMSPSPDQASLTAVLGDALIIEEQINTSSIASPTRDIIVQEQQEPPRIVAVEPVVAEEEVKENAIEG